MPGSDYACNELNIFPNVPSLHTGDHHWHGINIVVKHPEVFYTLEGGILMQYGGKSFVVPEGHAVYMPADTPYTCWSISEKRLSYINFSFSMDWNDTDFFSKIYIDTENPVVALPKNQVMDVYSASGHFSKENIPQRMNVCVQNAKLLVLLFNAFWQRVETEQLYKDVVGYMRARLSEEITLDALAALRDADPDYFSKKFKQTAGVSPQHFLSRLRLWHAASLLCETDAAVCDVAAAVGFSDVYYFKTFFKNFFGVPPEGYKKIFVEPGYVKVKR